MDRDNEHTGAVVAGSITHDAYQKALDRLLRDLRVESGCYGSLEIGNNGLPSSPIPNG